MRALGNSLSQLRWKHRRAVQAAMLLMLALLCGASAGCRGDEPVLHELGSLEQLEASFNADFGKPRIVLLLSPT